MKTATIKNQKLAKWIKKVGFWGFLFFLAKGIVWLIAGYLLIK